MNKDACPPLCGANGAYGSMQGLGGLEALVTEITGSVTRTVTDFYGNNVANITGTNTLTWAPSTLGGYGVVDGAPAPQLDSTHTPWEAILWRGHYIDPTGYYYMGARYYEPTSGRFLSPDPLGHAASISLYDYANGDPVNSFDPDGRLSAGWNAGNSGHVAASDPNSNAFWAGAYLGAGWSGVDEVAHAKYQNTVLGAYATPAIVGDYLSGGQWSQPADDQHVTANQMYYQWVMGTGPDRRNFDQNSIMGGQMMRADYVINGVQGAGKTAFFDSISNNNLPASVYTGRSLGNLNPIYYATIDFPNDVILGNNPARGLQGSISGLTTFQSFSSDNNNVYVNANVSLADKLSASSGTHLPPIPFVGYGSSLLGNNPFGSTGPMRTIETSYNLNVSVPFDIPKISIPNVVFP